MVRIDCEATWEGRPLEVLGRLVEQRAKYLGESTQDACVATGMMALQALRARTKTAPKFIPKADVRFGETPPKYITGKNRKAYRRVVVSRYRGGQKKNLVRWQEATGGKKRDHATSADLSAAWRRFGKISNRGLAKHALGVALMQLGTRTASAPGNARLSRIASAAVSVSKSVAGNVFTLQIRDGLGYAALALQGGPATINTALMAAANRTAGRLAKVAETKFGETVPTPFPEVANRRAK